MIRVLMVAGGPPARPHGLAEALDRLRAAGAMVDLVGDDEPSRSGARLWAKLRHDGDVRRAATRAHVLVALDPHAVHAVWQLARRNPAADAVFGLGPALEAVRSRRGQAVRHAARRLLSPAARARFAVRSAGGATVRGGRVAVRAATGTRVHRLRLGRLVWQSALRVVPLPDRARVPLTRRVTVSLSRAGFPEQATATLSDALRRLPRPARRAKLLADVAGRDLAEGRLPACLTDATIAELTVADAAYARRDLPATAAAVRRATRLLFHRVAHLDRLDSPALPEPAGYLAPWHRSMTGRALSAPRGRARPATRRPPRRVLFLHADNDNFLGAIQDRCIQRPGTETRRVNIMADPALKDAAIRPLELLECLLGGSTAFQERLEHAIRPYLDWADLVWVDWCNEAAGLLSAVDPGAARVVLRLHSAEAFTEWPHLIDPSRVDDLVFVSDHLRDFTLAAAPRLATTRVTVLPNAADLRACRRPKPPEARFTVALVGYSSIAKDPLWALRVLRLLRLADDRYRLLLIGSGVDGRRSAAGRRYQQEFESRLADAGAAVASTGQTRDVPAALTAAGTVLSSSVRESFHCGLVEGAASGAVPVVRDWPYFAERATGARTLFPAEWIVRSPEEAAARILTATATAETWHRTRRAAAEHTLNAWDWTTVAPAYDDFLFG